MQCLHTLHADDDRNAAQQEKMSNIAPSHPALEVESKKNEKYSGTVITCHWKFQRGGESQKPKFLKESIRLNWNFQGGGGRGSNQKTFHEWYGYFLGQCRTTHFIHHHHRSSRQ